MHKRPEAGRQRLGVAPGRPGQGRAVCSNKLAGLRGSRRQRAFVFAHFLSKQCALRAHGATASRANCKQSLPPSRSQARPD